MQRLSRLDGLRGVLAVYVMLGHAMPFVVLPGWVKAPFSHGEAAVDLFFSLSGLVIISSLQHFSYRFWPFMRARARRLLPVYFTALAFAVMLLGLGSPAGTMPWLALSGASRETWEMLPPQPFFWHLATHVLLLHGLLPDGLLPYGYISLLGPAWSLSTEWQFYILMALVLPLIKSRHRVEVFTLGLLALAVVYHLAAPALPPGWRFSRAFLPDAAAFFALGLASHIMLRRGDSRFFWVCLVTASALGLDSPIASKAAIPLLWGVVMLVQRRREFPGLGALLDSRLAQFLGAVSYPLYLINEPMQRGAAMLISPFMHGDAAMFTAIWLPMAVITPVLAAVLLHYGLEKPLMKPRVLTRRAAMRGA